MTVEVSAVYSHQFKLSGWRSDDNEGHSISFVFTKPFSQHSCPVDCDTIITPINIEMFHHILDRISQKNFIALNCRDSPGG